MWYDDVETVLGRNAGAERYFLFCNSDYEIKKKSSDQAQDAQGNPLTNEATGNKLTISRSQLPVLCSLLDPERRNLRRGQKEP